MAENEGTVLAVAVMHGSYDGRMFHPGDPVRMRKSAASDFLRQGAVRKPTKSEKTAAEEQPESVVEAPPTPEGDSEE